MRSVMKVQVEIQPVARATTPTIGTARMTSLAGEKQPPALLAAGHDEQDAGRRVDDERPEDERRSGGEQQECGVDNRECPITSSRLQPSGFSAYVLRVSASLSADAAASSEGSLDWCSALLGRFEWSVERRGGCHLYMATRETDASPMLAPIFHERYSEAC
jgi:hypothetical protein